MSDDSIATISGTFATREAADRAVEHLVQEHGIDRADIFVQAEDAQIPPVARLLGAMFPAMMPKAQASGRLLRAGSKCRPMSTGTRLQRLSRLFAALMLPT